jgi:hypothetical protein
VPLPIGNLLGRFTAQTASETLGFGVGVALAEALRPEATLLGQESWSKAPTKAVDATLAAAIVAEAVDTLAWGEGEAAQHGIDGERFAAILGEALNAPAVGELLRMRRRKTINQAAFVHGLRKAKLPEEWDTALAELETERLDPAEIAKAIHRGIMKSDGLLVAVPPATPGRVPMVPASSLDPLEEAAASGYDAERLRILTGNAGLPPGAIQMLELLNRGVIEESDFLRGVGESNLRNEWGPALAELRRRLLTPHEYVEARLRGWIDDQAMRAGAGLVGMQAADTDLLAKLSGRPLSFRQVFIGLARGGRYDGPTGDIDPAFLKALQESNIRPEWYSLAWAQRYSYPSAFVLRQLTAGGELTGAEAEQILRFEGWEPTLAKKVAARWAAGGSSSGKTETKAELEDEYAGGFMTEKELRSALELLGYTGHAQDLIVHLGDARRVKRWREKIVDAIGAAYLSFKVTDQTATDELAELSITGEAATLLLTLWGKLRRDSIRLLTPPQVKRAYKKGLITHEAALAELEAREYQAGDAELFLAS